MKYSILLQILRWLAILLIVRVLVTILSNYSDYFPPNFQSLFLEGREATFAGLYAVAFYIHIFSSPFVLLNGLLLVSSKFHLRQPKLHRLLGRAQVLVLLLLVLPSSVIMSRHAFGGWWAGLSFHLLSFTTATCAIMGVIHARKRQFVPHRRWMLRCYILICSAVVLRLVSGTLGLMGVSNAELAYILAAWCSWVLPLLVLELIYSGILMRLWFERSRL